MDIVLGRVLNVLQINFQSETENLRWTNVKKLINICEGVIDEAYELYVDAEMSVGIKMRPSNFLKTICDDVIVAINNALLIPRKDQFLSALVSFVIKLFSNFIIFDESDLSEFRVGLYKDVYENKTVIGVCTLNEVALQAFSGSGSFYKETNRNDKLFIVSVCRWVVHSAIAGRRKKVAAVDTDIKLLNIVCSNFQFKCVNEFSTTPIYKNNIYSAVVSLVINRLNIKGLDISSVSIGSVGSLRYIEDVTSYYQVACWGLNSDGSIDTCDDKDESIHTSGIISKEEIILKCIDISRIRANERLYSTEISRLCNFVHYALTWHNINVLYPNNFFSALVSFVLIDKTFDDAYSDIKFDRLGIVIRKLSVDGIKEVVYLIDAPLKDK